MPAAQAFWARHHLPLQLAQGALVLALAPSAPPRTSRDGAALEDVRVGGLQAGSVLSGTQPGMRYELYRVERMEVTEGAGPHDGAAIAAVGAPHQPSGGETDSRSGFEPG